MGFGAAWFDKLIVHRPDRQSKLCGNTSRAWRNVHSPTDARRGNVRLESLTYMERSSQGS